MDNSDLTNGNLITDKNCPDSRSEISVTLTPLILILKIKFVTSRKINVDIWNFPFGREAFDNGHMQMGA